MRTNSRKRLYQDLSVLQELSDQLDPANTDPNNQFTLKMYTALIQQCITSLGLLREASWDNSEQHPNLPHIEGHNLTSHDHKPVHKTAFV